jgi:hypothetical protein
MLEETAQTVTPRLTGGERKVAAAIALQGPRGSEGPTRAERALRDRTTPIRSVRLTLR